ncbi:metal-dependent transcriptional regulator [Sporomusa sphaeroides]|uniref:Manganese transport regulator n=1 Tax=Sporomusa sphaeroides DSM 2875 TaxID=1337886 RepID=A0ABM9W251_9FIRM|nr:iron dependent repressor, metal binding and dimerization domain protein [Sporomusa sphaeroides]OLS55873.1 transcriptional regulator MntR [Sporomusa sphaeroides DSM 2875]CVK18874.1 Transcriptional regulator MntR [Sporomusa sphaeroides DSM 2875]
MKSDFHTFRGYQLLIQQQQALTPSMEDYLEMIYRNCVKEGHVRMNQLADQLNVRSSSVTKIVQKLAELDFLIYRPYGIIQLTEKGTTMGKFLLQRHNMLKDFLEKLGLTGTLLQDTEMLEHHVSLELLKTIRIFLLFLENQPAFLQAFTEFRQTLPKATPAIDLDN